MRSIAPSQPRGRARARRQQPRRRMLPRRPCCCSPTESRRPAAGSRSPRRRRRRSSASRSTRWRSGRATPSSRCRSRTGSRRRSPSSPDTRDAARGRPDHRWPVRGRPDRRAAEAGLPRSRQPDRQEAGGARGDSGVRRRRRRPPARRLGPLARVDAEAACEATRSIFALCLTGLSLGAVVGRACACRRRVRRPPGLPARGRAVGRRSSTGGVDYELACPLAGYVDRGNGRPCGREGRRRLDPRRARAARSAPASRPVAASSSTPCGRAPGPAATSFQPFIGCIPTSGGGGRALTGAARCRAAGSSRRSPLFSVVVDHPGPAPVADRARRLPDAARGSSARPTRSPSASLAAHDARSEARCASAAPSSRASSSPASPPTAAAGPGPRCRCGRLREGPMTFGYAAPARLPRSCRCSLSPATSGSSGGRHGRRSRSRTSPCSPRSPARSSWRRHLVAGPPARRGRRCSASPSPARGSRSLHDLRPRHGRARRRRVRLDERDRRGSEPARSRARGDRARSSTGSRNGSGSGSSRSPTTPSS